MTSVATVMGACRSPSGSARGRSAAGRSGTPSWAGCCSPRCSPSTWCRPCTCIFDGLLARVRGAGARPGTRAGPGGGRVIARACSSRCRPRRRRRAGADTLPAGDPEPRRSAARPGWIPTTSGRWARSTTRSGAGGRRCWRSFCPSSRSAWIETKYSQEFFNPANPAGTHQHPGRWASASASYEIFSVRKFAELGRTKAELASAEAGELEQRFQRRAGDRVRATTTCSVNQELTRVADERVGPGRGGAGRRPGAGRLGRRGADRLAAAGAGADPARRWTCCASERAPDRPARARAPGRRARARWMRRRSTARRRPELPIGVRRGGALARSTRARSTGRPGPTSAPRRRSLKSQRGDYLPTPEHRRHCTSATTQLLPRRAPTSARSRSACRSRSGTTGSARSPSQPGPGQSRRGAGHPRRPRARRAAAT